MITRKKAYIFVEVAGYGKFTAVDGLLSQTGVIPKTQRWVVFAQTRNQAESKLRATFRARDMGSLSNDDLEMHQVYPGDPRDCLPEELDEVRRTECGWYLHAVDKISRIPRRLKLR